MNQRGGRPLEKYAPAIEQLAHCAHTALPEDQARMTESWHGIF
jgi:hypothetical protein